ncbi:MAG: cobalt ECF transporter T component CbiQ [Ignavibacteriales bacterium]|nr:cobalt ECF transporter T component CbiQ [Ignavibacteriales bacterium]
MRHDFLDRYSRQKSSIHNLPTPIKLLASFLIIIGTVTLPHKSWIFFGGIGLFLVIIVILSKLPIRFLFRRIIMLEPFVLGVSILTLFQTDGIILFSSIAIKSTISLLTMLILSNTTPFENILSLLKKIDTPELIVTILALFYRYLFVLIDEAEKMQRARSSRTFKPSLKNIWNSRIQLISELFIRSTERAERIYSAMRARGWS